MKTLLTHLFLLVALLVSPVLSAQTAPAIVTQPVSVTVPAYSSVTFAVVATGSPTPTYQWLKNDIAIPDASWRKATLTLDGVTSNDETYYSVVVTNSAGSVTSNKAKLTLGTVVVVVVPPAPTPTPTPAPTNMMSASFKADGSFWFSPSAAKTLLTFECGKGSVVIDIVAGTVTLPPTSVQPLDATATAFWQAVVAAFPAAKLAIKAAP